MSQRELDIARHGYCETELRAAMVCVRDTKYCDACFDQDPEYFLRTFPADAEFYFQSAMAFTNPRDPGFCVEANWRICKNFSPIERGDASCCCLPQTKAYMQCMFRDTGGGWLHQFHVTDRSCEYEGCEMFNMTEFKQTGAVEVYGHNDDSKEALHKTKSSSSVGPAIGFIFLVMLVLGVVCWYAKRRRYHMAIFQMNGSPKDPTLVNDNDDEGREVVINDGYNDDDDDIAIVMDDVDIDDSGKQGPASPVNPIV